MNDSTQKTASCSSITEKRPDRHGGCAGIFFQLLNWNRKLAKKKLFSRKLLSSVRSKQTSNKFGGDKKLPKLSLIADENSGGFPNVMKGAARDVNFKQKHATRAPSLVARLMGLEYMPAVQQDKSKKSSFSEICSDGEGKLVSGRTGGTKEDVDLEKVTSKLESRPQKLQKTGSFGRQPVARFGAEALHIRSVLSRTRKHHPKLASTVKSPALPPGREPRNSRLINAASRILEPGLQATSRAKCALTYLNPMHHALKDPVNLEEIIAISPDSPGVSNYYTTAAKSVKRHSSCKNCGNLLDAVHSRTNVEERPVVFTSVASNYANPSSQRSKCRESSLEQGQDRTCQNNCEQSPSLAARNNIQAYAEPITFSKPLNQKCQIQQSPASEWCKPQKRIPSSIDFNTKTVRQNQIWQGRDWFPPSKNLSYLQGNGVSSAAITGRVTKNFVALNQSLIGQMRTRVTSSVDKHEFAAGMKSSNARYDSISPLWKKMSANLGRQGESFDSVSSNFGKQINIRGDAMNVKEMGLNSHPISSSCSKVRLGCQQGCKRTASDRNNNITSCALDSPMKHKTGIPSEMEAKRRGGQSEVTCTTSLQKNSPADDSSGKTFFQKSFPLYGDGLGALLEQKLKELTVQEVGELASGGDHPKRTTAMVLQELISMITAMKPVHSDGTATGSVQRDDSCYTDQPNKKTLGVSVGSSRGATHLSPGSILEASFSNDSCFSSSLDDNSGHRLCHDFVDSSYYNSRPFDRDAEILDSATSLNKWKTGNAVVTNLFNHISEVVYSIQFAAGRLEGWKLTHAKDVILNAELIFGNAAVHDADGSKEFSLSHFLLDELETLASVMWMNLGCFLGFAGNKEGNYLRQFIFDSVIEYLDSNYLDSNLSGFRMWTKRPLCMNSDMLINEVVEEVAEWRDLSRLALDELIEETMTHSLGKWTDFEIEAFETGADIGRDILELLIDEVVIDLQN